MSDSLAVHLSVEMLAAEVHRLSAALAAAEEREARLREALRDANTIIDMTRKHLTKDHPDCAYEALGVMNDATRAALASRP